MSSCPPSIASPCRYNQLQTLFVTMTDRESLHARRYNSTRGAAPHAVRAWRCPLLYLQVGEFSGETSIVAVLRLKLLNLLPTLLLVHSAFLGVGGFENLDMHCSPNGKRQGRGGSTHHPHNWKALRLLARPLRDYGIR
jgi:hypothetical protein